MEFKPKKPQLVAACNEINGVLEEGDKIVLKVGIKNEEIVDELKSIAPDLLEEDNLSVETLTLIKNIGGELPFEIPSNGGNGSEPEPVENKKEKSTPMNYPVMQGNTRIEKLQKAIKFLTERKVPFTQRDLKMMLADDPGNQEVWHAHNAILILKAAQALTENEDGTMKIVSGSTS